MHHVLHSLVYYTFLSMYSGSIPPEIGNLTSLIELQLGWNSLEGMKLKYEPKKWNLLTILVFWLISQEISLLRLADWPPLLNWYCISITYQVVYVKLNIYLYAYLYTYIHTYIKLLRHVDNKSFCNVHIICTVTYIW